MEYYIDFQGPIQEPLPHIKVTRPRPRVRIGALVVTPLGLAYVQNIGVSPYWHEEKQSVKRAYVYSANWETGDRWVEYFLLDELVVLS
jgi:hypothetical protein